MSKLASHERQQAGLSPPSSWVITGICECRSKPLLEFVRHGAGESRRISDERRSTREWPDIRVAGGHDPPRKRLPTYLNDHLAGSTGGLELAKRTRSSNEGTPYEEFLTMLVREIDEDRETLKAIMDRLDVEQNQLKVSLGWIAEKVGRLSSTTS